MVFLLLLCLHPAIGNDHKSNDDEDSGKPESISTQNPVISYPKISVGVLSQFHMMSYQSISSAQEGSLNNYNRTWERQTYLRRMRILVGGSITERTSFFFETDAPNIGYVNSSGEKNTRISMFVQDAQIQHNFSDNAGFIAGLQIVGITRNGLQSAASLMALNYGAYQFFANAPLDNLVGRDLGINLRGFLFDQRLEYRAGLFSGKNDDRTSPYRFTARFNYSFLDREKGFFYSGTTLGSGSVFSIGGGVDVQDNYYGLAVDSFFDYPVFTFGSLTASASYTYVNCSAAREGRNDFSGMLPRQNIVFAEAGIFLPGIKIQPYVKYELKDVRDGDERNSVANKLRSGSRVGFGLNHYISSHRMNIKILYERVTGNYPGNDFQYYQSITRNEIVMQIQYFSF